VVVVQGPVVPVTLAAMQAREGPSRVAVVGVAALETILPVAVRLPVRPQMVRTEVMARAARVMAPERLPSLGRKPPEQEGQVVRAVAVVAALVAQPLLHPRSRPVARGELSATPATGRTTVAAH